ncbi:acid phosphatase [Fusarium beomiforme]|uniref:Acid phosphatase n=1 Tax=Fusarium beomiforme TaxID=44412 RepID=A0A9P5DVZ4_9HYPO|nr:acid phosphatase [Fusarium beomiforme]
MYSKALSGIPLGLLVSTAAAETIHGVVVFSRHGDRTTKWYGVQSLTSLGAEQNFQVGSDYRSRYLSSDSDYQILGISEDEYKPSQIFASAPDQGILMNTATAFLQGLYPPLVDLDPEIASQTLNNGSESQAPLDGYQYVRLHTINDNSPDTIWIKGDDACPKYKTASKAFFDSDVFAQRVEDTKDFYASFYDVLSDGVYNLKPENMTYENAFNIFDLVNVARIHNSTSPARNVSDKDLFQLRTLADSAELGQNWNASEPARAIGAETLSGAVLAQLNETVASEGKLKFSLFAGSYDTFLAFFGLAGLLDESPNFHGLPDYASTMAFELFTDEDADEFPSDPEKNLRVRWLFRNSTFGELETFPLFGTDEESLSWPRFVSEMEERAITDVGDWCAQCASEEDFCAAYETDDESAGSQGEDNGSKGGMSNAVAGVIGAMVTLGVVAVVGAVAFALMRRKRSAAGAPAEKGSVRSGSTDATPANSHIEVLLLPAAKAAKKTAEQKATSESLIDAPVNEWPTEQGVTGPQCEEAQESRKKQGKRRVPHDLLKGDAALATNVEAQTSPGRTISSTSNVISQSIFAKQPYGGQQQYQARKPDLHGPFISRRTNSLPARITQSFAGAAPGAIPAYVPIMMTNVPGDNDPEYDRGEHQHISRTSAIILLVSSTGLVAVCAEFMVNSINDVVAGGSGICEAFIDLILLSLVGNAAEHVTAVTAVTVAMKNKMDLAIGVAVGSSTQIAIFVTPLVVILGWIMDKEMSLLFTLFETVSMFVSAFIVNFLVLDGRSNYLEGALLISAYIIIAVVGFFYLSKEANPIGGGVNLGSQELWDMGGSL